MACKPLSCLCGKLYIPQRYLLSFLCFMAIVNMFNMRVSLNLVINAMVPLSNRTIDESTKKDYCPGEIVSKGKKKLVERENWSSGQIGFIKAAFYIGYVPAHIPGGILADYFGGRKIMLISMISSSVLTLLLPIIVEQKLPIVVGVSRIVVGIGQGLAFPAVSTLLAKWVPKKERAFLGSFAMSGSHVGTITANSISGWLTDVTNSWKTPFYFWGSFSLAFCSLFLVWVWSTPDDNKFVLPQEKELLENEMISKKRYKTPFWKILIDKVVIAMTIGQFGHAWVFFTFNTDLPKYMQEVLKFDIKSNGLLSSLPSLGMWISSILCGLLSDWLYKKKHVRIINLRRWFTFAGNVIPAAICCCVTLAGCNQALAVFILVLVLTAKGPFYCGIKVNYLDITQNFAGLVCGLNNGLAAIAGVMTPYMINLICKDGMLRQWNLYFLVSLAISTVTTIIYMILTGDERRKWDYVEDKPPTKTDDERGTPGEGKEGEQASPESSAGAATTSQEKVTKAATEPAAVAQKAINLPATVPSKAATVSNEKITVPTVEKKAIADGKQSTPPPTKK